MKATIWALISPILEISISLITKEVNWYLLLMEIYKYERIIEKTFEVAE